MSFVPALGVVEFVGEMQGDTVAVIDRSLLTVVDTLVEGVVSLFDGHSLLRPLEQVLG